MSVVRSLQLYLEMSVVLGLSICTATTKNFTVGNENVVLGCFGDREGWWGGKF